MSRSLSPRVGGSLALAGAGLVAALATGRPELAVLAAPFLVFVAAGLALAGSPRLSAELELERDRVIEDEQIGVTVTVRNEGESGVEIAFAIQRTGQLSLAPADTLLLYLGAGERRTLQFTATALRWGSHPIGPLAVQARDRLGVAIWRGYVGSRLVLRAFPREQRLRQLVAPLRTQPFLGSHVARMRGEGIEFADVRQYVPGDRMRQVNWRATARRGALYVTERHPEHASDVVLLLDTFAEARDGAAGTLDAAVRAAASVARAHLARRDRVALVDFGGTLQWLEPAFGATQLYRIVDALLASEIAFSYAWRAVQSIPRRVLPPAALIVTISPLLDERSIRLVTDLRRRGADVTIVEVSPLERAQAGESAADALAHRLWRLEREAMRGSLRALGIAVAVWEEQGMLGPALEGVNAFRRSARRALPA